ncbi:MAG TPA: glycosyl transferase family protein [Allosphingosinicella sp.]|jgi:adsorption protein B
MDWGGPILTSLDVVVREAALFAAVGFLILAAGDLLVDAIWLALRARRGRAPLPGVESLPAPQQPGTLAVFIPAWDEAGVIGAMLRSALSSWGPGDYRIYVGCYSNDPATIAAVREVDDPRLRLVIGSAPGPTTKADCLNRLWDALLADELAGGSRTKAVILHDAEDLVSPDELSVFASGTEHWDLVQLPVEPLIHPRSRWIGGHYADEFAQAHGKELPVRLWLGAGLPSAGVGCAFSRDMLGRIAAEAGGTPFDAASLTEDYELGLRVAQAGGRATFLRVTGRDGGLVVTREYFPGTVRAAVRQKARWMTGIALAGWDRLGWHGSLAERWMRLRDRQSPLAALLLLAAYLSLALWVLAVPLRMAMGTESPGFPPLLNVLALANLYILGWRLVLRAAFTASIYGWREGLRSIPRAVIGNGIAVLAAISALARYWRLRRTGRAEWGKTDHIFPITAAAQ